MKNARAENVIDRAASVAKTSQHKYGLYSSYKLELANACRSYAELEFYTKKLARVMGI